MPTTAFQRWAEGFDARCRPTIPAGPIGGHSTMQTIALPKRTRETSFKDEDVQDALDTLAALPEGSREAVVVGTGFDTESGARNRARLLCAALTERTQVLYSAHAVPDPENDGKFIGAVSVRANQDPREQPAEREEGAPTMRALQQAARDAKIKGRSRMSYDELRDALDKAGVDPASYGKG
jgi:hypothetical protein